jgi:hypothetical protein
VDRGDRQARPVRRLKHVDSGVDLGVRAMDMGFSIVGCLYCLRSSSLCFCLSGLHLFNVFPHPSTILYPVILLFFLVLYLFVPLCVFCIPYLPIWLLGTCMSDSLLPSTSSVRFHSS